MDTSEDTKLVNKVYGLLSKTKKPKIWWPGQDPFEIIVGAILTQSTSWKNVEKSLIKLNDHGLLNPRSINDSPPENLGELIKSSLYFNQKTRKLKEFTSYLFKNYCGNIEKIKKQNTHILREELLSIWGIGPETADSILLYALDKPVFVIDAYTKRLFSRLGVVNPKISYGGLQKIFMKNLKTDVLLFKDYHGLIVDHSKEICTKRNPDCDICPLTIICEKKF